VIPREGASIVNFHFQLDCRWRSKISESIMVSVNVDSFRALSPRCFLDMAEATFLPTRVFLFIQFELLDQLVTF
jgi:hypothetical protein